ncbi:MAG: caspase family protein [Chitinophagaceae bacterium]
MKIFFTGIALIVFTNFSGFAQTQAKDPIKKALVIGIDTYSPPSNSKEAKSTTRPPEAWNDLSGCKNDAEAMREILISKFGFAPTDVKELYNTKATRATIIRSLRELLNTTPENGIAVFYYAGHGSQIRNSLAQNDDDGYNETIVPADVWRKDTVDITDKQMSAIFGEFVKKKIKLTAIFDCCQSGSMARGLFEGKSRYINRNEYDLKDPSNPTPPEEIANSGYLRISASQADEVAKEHKDDNPNVPNDKRTHGAFTLALMKVLDQQSAKASAQNIFTAIGAIIKSFSKPQEPVMAGDPSRYNETLFGIDKSLLSDNLSFPIMSLLNKKIILQAGYASGINPDNELTAVNDSTLKIKVINIMSLNQSEVSIIAGSAASVKAGMKFKVTNWVSSKAPLLKIYIPKSSYTYDEITKQASVNMQLKQSSNVGWSNKIETTEPDVTINIQDRKITARDFTTNTKDIILKDFSVAETENLAKGKTLFVNMAPPKKLQDMLVSKFSEFKTIKLVEKPEDANYILYGTLDAKNNVAYGLLKTDFSLRDSLGSMPVDAGCFTLKDNAEKSYVDVVDSVFETCVKLSKIRGWLTLAPPKEQDYFPYSIVLRNSETKQLIDSGGLKIGEKFDISVEANDSNYLQQDIPPKYIYVFTIDKHGTMTPVYPGRAGQSEGKFPRRNNNGNPMEKFIVWAKATASAPSGTDNYFLIASETQIPDSYTLFKQEGVRGNPRGSSGPLAELLKMGNLSGARGVNPNTPANWNLYRLAVKVTY